MIPLLLVMLAAPAPAAAPSAPSVSPLPLFCRATVVPAAPFAGWGTARSGAQRLAIGRAADLRAMPVANVRLAVQPSRPLSGDYFVSAMFEVTVAGRYSVAVGGAKEPLTPLWLDVAGSDGKPLGSVGHAHGPACTGITKIVHFELAPGRYTLMATGLTTARPVRALIVRQP